MTKIIPTEGRIVWFYGHVGNLRQAAIVAGVTDGGVELWVFQRSGSVYSGTYWVPSILDPDELPTGSYHGGSYATWMPYQKGQAAKAEAYMDYHSKAPGI